jgi:hypothetical protein
MQTPSSVTIDHHGKKVKLEYDLNDPYIQRMAMPMASKGARSI